MKHILPGLLFLWGFFLPKTTFAAINVTISDLQQKEDYFQLTAMVTGMSSSSGTFIQGMFTPADSNKYFGFTYSKKGEWLQYASSPEKAHVLENYIELKNDQPTTIYVKPNYEDKDYSGPGKYLIKLKRYTASGSPSDYSNHLEIQLSNSQPTSTPSPTEQIPTPTTTVTSQAPTSTQQPPPPKSTPTSTITKISTVNPTSKVLGLATTNEATYSQVLATFSSQIDLGGNQEIITESEIATQSSQGSKLPISDKNMFLGGMIILSVSGGALYFRLKNL